MREERDHLLRLADLPAPPSGGTGRSGARRHVHPGVLDRPTATPAQVITYLYRALVRNRLAVALLGAAPAGTGMETGFVHRWLTDPAARFLCPSEDQAQHSRIFVADPRAAAARRGSGDEEAPSSGGRTPCRSPAFSILWEQRDGAVRRADRNRIVHSRRRRGRLPRPAQRRRSPAPAVVPPRWVPGPPNSSNRSGCWALSAWSRDSLSPVPRGVAETRPGSPEESAHCAVLSGQSRT